MSKKKNVKKAAKKSNKKNICDPAWMTGSAEDKERQTKTDEKYKLIQQGVIPASYDYYQMKANNLIYDAFVNENMSQTKLDRIAEILKTNIKNNIIDGYEQEVKTRTFVSTTFDDVVAFPKYPVSKPGYHINKEVTTLPNSDVLITKTKFEKNDTKNSPLESFVKHDKPADDGIKILKDLAKEPEIKKLGDEQVFFDIIKEAEDKKIENVSDAVYEKLGKAVYVKELSESKELLEKLDDLSAKITKEYWQSKRKFILMNKFLEDFYSNKTFLDPIDHLNIDNDKFFEVLEEELSHGVDEKLKKLAQYGKIKR